MAVSGNQIRHVTFHDEGDTAEARLKVTLFCVEATHFEQHMLWSRWSADSLEKFKLLFVKWEQLGGWAVTVGQLDNRPVVVSMDWARIDGHLVMFWCACSQVTDAKQADDWFTRNFTGTWGGGRRAMCDASNFHHAEQAIKEFRSKSHQSSPHPPSPKSNPATRPAPA